MVRAKRKPVRKKAAKKVAAKRVVRKRDPVTEYARAVKCGRIPAGRAVRLACERHLRDLKRKDLKWQPEEATRAIAFFRDMLVLDDGSPFVLQRWQAFVIGSLFGWYGLDGCRRFRTAFIETGKGNGKTPMAAGLGLYGLVADGEGSPEIYAAAVTRDQANITFRDATRMVEGSPELAALITPQVRSLTIPADNAVFRPVSSEHRGLDGLRVHIGLLDEVHEHPTALVVDKIRAGTKGRRNALIFEITNAGYDRNSVCWKHHEYSLAVLEGTTPNDSWFAYVCQLDEGDDFRNERTWRKANPNLGHSITLKYLREQVAEAIGIPSKLNIVLRLNFCVWTEQATRWLDLDVWDKCGGPMPEPEPAASFYGGLDMASSFDLCAFAKVFGPDEEGVFDVLLRFWMPIAQVEARAKRGQAHFLDWAHEGWISTTEGATTNYDFVEAAILEDCERWELRELAFDRWNITQLVTHLQDKLGHERLVQFGQGFASMSSPSKELERLVLDGKIRHGGNPVLRWMASNAAARQDAAGNIKPDREHSADKIDGIVALVMALARAIAAGGDEPQSSVYDERAERGEEVLRWL